MESSEDVLGPRLSPARIILFVGAVLAGVLAAALVITVLFRVLPSDMTRIQVLLDALRADEPAPQFIVFGDSTARDGIDTRVISKLLPGNPLGYNFGAPNQTLGEVALLLQNVPESCETIVLYANPRRASRHMVPAQKLSGYYLYGYRLQDETKSFLRSIYGDSQEGLDKNFFEHAFGSRWIVRSTIDTFARNLLRPDLAIEQANYDLFFPHSGEKKLTGKALQRNIATHWGTQNQIRFRYQETTTTLLTNLVDLAHDKELRVVVVSAPVNPAVFHRIRNDFIPRATEFYDSFAATNDVLHVNAMTLLEEEDFKDAVHPNQTGAKKLSAHIGESLATYVMSEGR